MVNFIKSLAASKNATYYTEVERLLKYSMNPISAYTHKSVEWPALYFIK